jgi:hypothetical protein
MLSAMRILDETSGEKARETDTASDTRRWMIGRDRPEPLSRALHVLIGLVLFILVLMFVSRL